VFCAKILVEKEADFMLSRSPNLNQKNLLYPNLLDQLDPKNPLLQLSKAIPWDYFETEFSNLYSHKGKPAKPIRLMVGLSILKHLENLSDDALIARWVQNPYYQVFCGEAEFQWKFPCDSSEMTYFRKRIGKEGFEKILAVSIHLHGEKVEEKVIHVDTTVQEKNITFPTDDKLYLKVIGTALKLAEEHGIQLRRSFSKEIKERKFVLRFRQHPKNQKKVRQAVKRLKTISGILLRELSRKLPKEVLENQQENFDLYWRVLKQKRHDKHKVYSLHEPHIYCMSKGKLHKRYEFGTKVSIAKTTQSNIIVGALAFEKNYYDGHTLPSVLAQVKKLSEVEPNAVWVDRGYRGKQRVNSTQIFYPKALHKSSLKKFSAFMQKQFRKRAGIEGIIGHLKFDHRLDRNYLKGFGGDQINVLMAAAAFNFRKWLRAILFWLQYLLLIVIAQEQNNMVVA
jgi:IS5 family transposase